MKKLLIFLLVATFSYLGSAQSTSGPLGEAEKERIKAIEDTLLVYAYSVLNDTLPERRFYSCKELIVGLTKALKIDNSFQYPFSKLQSVSVQYPADSSFRIFTWQLYVDKDDYRYYGAIQMNSKDLQLIPLVDRSFHVVDIEQETLAQDKWYGAVYYKLKQVNTPQGKYYLLFGFDGFEFFRKRKVIDVLQFDEEGKPVFGLPVFVKEEENGLERTFKRLYIEYSAEVSTKMNYDELYEMIIFDHMIEREGPHGEGVVKYPDGSYEGYRLEDGLWKHVPKIFTQIQDEAPRPFPKLDEANKDIFGQKKKN